MDTLVVLVLIPVVVQEINAMLVVVVVVQEVQGLVHPVTAPQRLLVVGLEVMVWHSQSLVQQ